MKKTLTLILLLALSSFAIADDQMDMDQLFSNVITAIKKKNYSVAQEDLRVALSRSKDESDKITIKILMARVNQEQGKGEEAVKSLSEIFENEQVPVELRLRVVLALADTLDFEANSNLKKELDYLQKASTLASDPVDFFVIKKEISRFYLRLSKYDLAMNTLKEILDRKDMDVLSASSTRVSIGEILVKQKDFQAARQEYYKVSNLQIKEAEKAYLPLIQKLKLNARIGIAESYAEEGDSQKAKQLYTEVLAVEELTSVQRVEVTKKLSAVDKIGDKSVSLKDP